MKNPCLHDHFLNNFQSCNKSNIPNLWHNRLGHLLIKKMMTLSLVPKDCIGIDFDSCIICHRSRQHKLSFNDNNTITNKPFELVHVDV